MLARSSTLVPLAAILLSLSVYGCTAPSTPASDTTQDAAPPMDAVSTPEDGGNTAGGSKLRNVDVTVLFPLPADAEQAKRWIGADTQARDGALLPDSVLAGGQVPELDERSPIASAAERRASLRVVAVRFDPCPGVLLPAQDVSACTPNVRLVFQSMRVQRGAFGAADGALHAFYSLNKEDFSSIVAKLRALRAASASVPHQALGVRAELETEGVDGTYGTKLRALLVESLSASQLVRITQFHRTNARRVTWEFSQRDKVNGAWRDSLVPTTSAARQQLSTISGGRWDADITPPLTHADDPTRAFKETAQSKMAEAFEHTLRALNPRIHSSESIDCSSCHIATDVAVFLQKTQKFSINNGPNAFNSSYPLDGTFKSEDASFGFENMHMLSYTGTQLGLSIRVVNETAAVLEQLNAD